MAGAEHPSAVHAGDDRVAAGSVTLLVDRPLWRRLDAHRRHARHGPIELLVEVDGTRDEVDRAQAAARAAFEPVLGTLAAELPLLRRPPRDGAPRPRGAVARRMYRAVLPHRARFVTPMAAVAGAVADHLLAAIRAASSPRRAFVNNGGDIALYLAGEETLRVALCADPARGLDGTLLTLGAGDGVGGVATSGWRGRSHSLGIADAVTVLARDAAGADAAATLLANAVDLPGSPRVRRLPANALAPDSDLGARAVTVDVAPLDARERASALARGERRARALAAEGVIIAARLVLQGSAVTVGAGAAPEDGDGVGAPTVAQPGAAERGGTGATAEGTTWTT